MRLWPQRLAEAAVGKGQVCVCVCVVDDVVVVVGVN